MLQLPKRVRAELGRRTFGAFLAEKSAFGESNFSAAHEIIASAHKTPELRWRKLPNETDFMGV